MRNELPCVKVRKSALLRLREWWTEEQELNLTQEELNDMVAIRLLNSLDIAGRLRGQNVMDQAGISAVATLLGEDEERAIKAYRHVAEIVRLADGKIDQKTVTVEEGSVTLRVTTVSLSKIKKMNLALIRSELGKARRRYRVVEARRPEKKSRHPRYSFLTARGESKL